MRKLNREIFSNCGLRIYERHERIGFIPYLVLDMEVRGFNPFLFCVYIQFLIFIQATPISVVIASPGWEMFPQGYVVLTAFALTVLRENNTRSLECPYVFREENSSKICSNCRVRSPDGG